ncbi:unnamed protein product [Macrosiphum euphorbiae]|uniref:MULE transposase domain-containing protein n=1 Tax=Macrosiphum euphorbiae TaxID=13131 RepID=A0AAV0W193_9HEMI|nr:unnamed protein product [Macrosiphum euphorbiae]
MSENVSFMLSEKGKQLLVLNNFKFFKHHTSKKNEITWRCVINKCSAKVYTLGQNAQLINTDKSCFDHNHASDSTLNRQQISNACKRKAVDSIVEKPSKIIRKEVSNYANEGDLIAPDLKLIARNIHNARMHCFPKLPTSRKEVHEILSLLDIKTNRGELFLYENDALNEIVIFSCKTNIDLLKELDVLYMDGTFNYSDKYYTQLYTIHGIKNGVYIPLMFCLLPNKEKKTYIALLKTIKIAGVIPKKIILDFEIAMHQAVFEIFPETEVFGCRFHLGQAWYRKIQNLGYAPQFNSANDDVGKWLVHIFGLPFLNPEEVAECFTEYFMADKPENAAITEFCDYLVDNYISNESIFPPKMWARQCSDRVHTTNACESFHSDFNSNFYHQHPNIFKIIEILKLFQVNTYIKIRTTINNPKPKISKKYAEKEDFINEKISDYRTSKINQYDYVKLLSYRNKPHKIK